MLPLLIASLLLGIGCVREPEPAAASPDPDTKTTPGDTASAEWCVPTEDLDGVGKDWDCDGYASDGYVGGTDCDDADATIHPGAEELCDGVDNDCDGEVESEARYLTWYPDEDGDGYGRTDGAAVACEYLDGHVLRGGDCDDGDTARSPGQAELCNGVDDNCDGENDEADDDGDGQRVCDGDCDDRDASAYAGAPELCNLVDENCDGVSDGVDEDGDGQRVCAGDCDDTEPTVFLGAPEGCDGLDNDCDGVVPADEADADGDSWHLCDADCDDAAADVHPGAVETCGDGLDEDCDGSADGDCADCDLAVPNDYPTIQAGVDAASTGDVVCVAAGTWTENLDFGGAEITVVGVHGASLTVIDGGELDSAVRFVSAEGPATTLRGFTLTNGYGWDGGGGVYVDGASPTLEDLIVTGNRGGYSAGGIQVDGGAPTFTRLVVTGNSAYASYCGASYGHGGGFGMIGSDAVLDDVVVQDNYAGYGGGGLYLDESDAVLTNVTIRGNTGGLVGGGLYIRESSPTLTNVVVTDNNTPSYWGLGSVPWGGGIALMTADPTLTNVLIAGNNDGAGVGALYGYDASPTLVNTLVTNNDGGLYFQSGTPSLAYCDIWDNGADYTGVTDPTGTAGNLSVDPMLVDSDHLDAASPLVDAGDPSILDPDGSPSDIGPFGGPGASSWDADLDGFPAWWLPGVYDAATSPEADCDDADAFVYPGSGC
ncbi:MAG: putative metal-binding motif-containing protein [Myxococcota bacterium]